LIGYLADVDFGSEKFRFLGGARFDIYGAYKLLSPDPVRAKIEANPPLPPRRDIDTLNPYTRDPSYHTLCVCTLPLLTPTFEFTSPGLALRPSSLPLLPWLAGSRPATPLDSIHIQIEDDHERIMSVDGERYKGREVRGEKVRDDNVFWTA